MSAKLTPIPEKDENSEGCNDCAILEEKIKTLTSRVYFLERLVFWGKMKDFIFDSLNQKGAFVQIKLIDGKGFHVPVNVHTSVKSLKDNIKEQEGIDTDRARLVFNGKTLEWNRTLLGLGIPSRGIIHLAMFPNKNAYPPFEELTPYKREKTMQDQYLLNEHMLKRDPKYHTHMKKKYDDYQSKRKAYFDSLQEN